MSNYHILQQALDKKTIRVVYHIAIPDVVNAAGLGYRAALVQYLTRDDASITSEIPNFATDFPAEETLLQSGALYEYGMNLRLSSLALTNPQKQAEIEAEYSVQVSEQQDKIQTTLEWWSYHANV